MKQKEKELLMAWMIDSIMSLSNEEDCMESMQNIIVHCIMASCDGLEAADLLLTDVWKEVEELDDMGFLEPID